MRSLIQICCIGCVLLCSSCNLISSMLFTAQAMEAKPQTVVMPANKFKKPEGAQVYYVDLNEKQRILAHYENQPVAEVRNDDLVQQLKDSNAKYKDKFFVVINAGKNADYKRLMKVLDILTINNITRYTLQD